ncbi:metal-dependent hydrolase [Halohasta litorea]|uniref:Metal-dependent hydrolase n=1 Tax=Halohasta litorea TaxID=869891 RepID=A0ABD6D8S5_9EURY|nr:metal-dependent hydrolase [Halohasta litorea]
MMLPTHAVIGLALAAPLVVLAPELAPAALAGGLLGGIVPDLDLYSGHRKTLHFPTGYLVAVLPTAVVAALVPQPAVVASLFFLVGAAAHCQMDRFGGGLELRPWEGGSERAVYDHVRGEWRRPKRWIPYDGSPRDLLLLSTVAIPLLVVLEAPFRLVVGLALLVGGVYVGLRRRLAAIAPIVFGLVPEALSEYVPDRYRN